MGVHSNRYPNPTKVNENVNAGFESFSTVSLTFSSGPPGYEGVGIWRVTFFILTLNVSILFKRDDVPYLSSFSGLDRQQESFVSQTIGSHQE